MIELATVAREETEKVKRNMAVKVLKDEFELEDSIRKSTKHGMNFTYVDTKLLVNKTAIVKDALEIFGYKAIQVGCNGKIDLKVEW